MIVHICFSLTLFSLPSAFSTWSSKTDVRLRPHTTALRVVALQKVVEMQKKMQIVDYTYLQYDATTPSPYTPPHPQPHVLAAGEEGGWRGVWGWGGVRVLFDIYTYAPKMKNRLHFSIVERTSEAM
jgi:hypothetical protein